MAMKYINMIFALNSQIRSIWKCLHYILLEHLSADIIRNYSDHIVDFSPMGCQTGFYVSLINHNDYEDLLTILENTFTDVTKATAVPACNEVHVAGVR